MDMEATAALLRDSSFAQLRPAVGKRFADPSYRYSVVEEIASDPEAAHLFRGLLNAVALGALLWVPILWLTF
jgi:hypothetical protein